MRKVVFASLALMALTAIGCGLGSETGSGTGSGGSEGNVDGDEVTVAKVGDPVRDGKFEFTVQEVECGVKEVGPDLLAERAQGQFCLVSVAVKNIGDEPQTFSDSNQKGYAADGTEYATNSTASLLVNEDGDTLFTEINPGNSLTGVIVFDIPEDANLARLELHDSAFSGGVSVELG